MYPDGAFDEKSLTRTLTKPHSANRWAAIRGVALLDKGATIACGARLDSNPLRDSECGFVRARVSSLVDCHLFTRGDNPNLPNRFPDYPRVSTGETDISPERVQQPGLTLDPTMFLALVEAACSGKDPSPLSGLLQAYLPTKVIQYVWLIFAPMSIFPKRFGLDANSLCMKLSP